MIRKILNSFKNFFIGCWQSIEYTQMKRAEVARKYWQDRWY